MKGIGYHPHSALDDATESTTTRSDPHRVSVRQVSTVLLVAAVLACLHREISGTVDGSLLSVFTGYAGGVLQHFVSILPHF